MSAARTHRSVLIAGQRVPYTLERKRVKNINLRVKRDGRVCVSASPWVPTAVIERFLVSRGAFLLRALESAAAAPGEGRPVKMSLLFFSYIAWTLYVARRSAAHPR